MPAPYDAILFDFDGVLVDSEPVHYECWLEILKPFAIPLDWETYCTQCIGVTDRAMLEVLSHQTDPPFDVERLYAEYPRKKEMFRERMVRLSPITAPIRELLDRLQPSFPLGLVTSSGRREVEPILEAAGIRPYFAAAVFGDEVKRHKPDPEPYRVAVERLGARRALAIEDSPAGIASARAAGLDVVEIAQQCDVPSRVLEALAT